MIFGCTDSQGSRAVLNDLSYQYLVPVIDMGCRVGIAEGRTRGIGTEVRLLHPDGPCSWCAGELDAAAIRAEMLPPDERGQLAAEGYVAGVDVQPSIIPVTTATAAAAVPRFLDMFLGLLGWDHERLVSDLHELFTFPHRADIDPECVCRQRLGVGDNRPVWCIDQGEDR